MNLYLSFHCNVVGDRTLRVTGQLPPLPGHVLPGHLLQGHIPPDTYLLETYSLDTYPLGHIPARTYTPGGHVPIGP